MVGIAFLVEWLFYALVRCLGIGLRHRHPGPNNQHGSDPGSGPHKGKNPP
jgi:hypothetical protein